LRVPGPDHARIHRFRLPLARVRVEVVDLGFTTPVASALGDGDLVVNGGFWAWHNMERRMLGLLVSGGKSLSPLRTALDGGVLLMAAGRARIVPSRSFHESLAVDLAVQCKPRLVESNKVIPDLKASGHAPRTAVCVREQGNTLDVYVSEPDDLGPTLQELAVFLAADGCEHALNLDGGPSTAAAYREGGKLVRIGPGIELPYAIRFSFDALHGASPHSAAALARRFASRSAEFAQQ
jgi:hypothetical protein